MSIKDLYNQQDAFSATRPDERNSSLVFSVPTLSEKPIVAKFLFDPSTGQKYIPMAYYPHMIGNDPEKDKRFHPSLKSIGLGEDLELTNRVNMYRELKALKESGKGSTPEAVVLEKKTKMTQSKEAGWFFFVEPGSPAIKAIKLPVSVLNRLFGKEFPKTGKTIPSLIKEMAQKGVSPFDVTSEKAEQGWVRIYKTGQGLGTEYVIEADQAVTEVALGDGETATKKTMVSRTLHDKIKKLDLTAEDFPKPIEAEKKNAMTVEETMEFIESNYTKVPDRMLKKHSTGATAYLGGNTEVQVESEMGPLGALDAGLASMDDIPF